MIINSHVHVNTDDTYFFYNDYNLSRLLQEMRQNKIDLAFPTLNPKASIFRCPSDCSMQCPMLGFKKNNNLNNCNCDYPKRHRVCVVGTDSELHLKCKTCGTILLRTQIDPLREYNIGLLNITKPYRTRLKPLLYITLCQATIQNEIDFFEKHFSNEFVGFKFHPWNDQVSVSNFKLQCSKPVLIHTGIRELESAENAITFAENNPSVKVIVAHAAALDENVLKKIAKMENVFVDCCPSKFMYDSKYSSIFCPEEIHSPEDIYYKVLEFLPSDKILFGTDSPWGNSNDELSVVNNLRISRNVKEQLLFKNALKVYLS